jgi:DNA-binding transcriptional regulator YiaG
MGVVAWTVLNWERNRTRPGARHWGRSTEFLGYFPLAGGEGPPERILEARQHSGLAQTELASVIGVDEDAVRD